MNRKPDVLRLLADARPAELDSVDLATLRARIPTSPLARTSEHANRCPARALALAAAIALALVGLNLLPLRSEERATSARDVLLVAAAHAAAEPSTTGRWWHESARTSGGSLPGMGTGRIGYSVEDRWTAASTADLSWVSFRVFDSTRERTLSSHALDTNDWGAHRFLVEGRGYTAAELQQLPTDPAALRSFLLAPYTSLGPDQATMVTTRILGEATELGTAPVPSAVRAEVYRILADRPGVRSLGHMKDALGRNGVAVAVDYDRVEYQLIIDPTTGAALETRQVLVRADPGRPGVRPGTVVLATTIVQAGWTDALNPPAPPSPSP